MTTLEVTLDLPDDMAKAARAAGLLTPRALRAMLRDAVKRHAAAQLTAGSARRRGRALPMREIQREVASVRRAGRQR